MVTIKQSKQTPALPSEPCSFDDRPGSSSPSTQPTWLPPSAAIPLSASEMKLHGGSGLSHPAPTVRCPDCAKPILRAAIAQHQINCQRIRDGLQPGDSTSTTSSHQPDPATFDDNAQHNLTSRDTDGLGAGLSTNKKRRLSDVSMSTSTPPPSAKKARPPDSGPDSTGPMDPPSFVERPSPAPSGSEAGTSSYGGRNGSNWGGDKDPLKKERAKIEKKLAKERKEQERRLQKAEPLDLDRRCGVINDKDTPCLRSLTCKSHGMGPKREVQGRSKPFDVLLLEWNRTNNPKWVEPKTRKKNQADFGDDGGKRNGTGSGGGSGGGKKNGSKRDHHGGGGSFRRRGGRGDDDSLDGGVGGRSSPESELASLIAAAQASRARLSAPFHSSSTFFGGGSSYRTGGGPLAMAGGVLPREGWKGSLFGRRRETVRALDRSFRDALGVK